MMIYSFGEIVLISFPYLDTTKQRPALVILDTGDDDFILAPIASQKRIVQGDCQLVNCGKQQIY
ncbi:MAG: hypothetical protein VSS52_002045 [Thiotrichaceae bacterium]|nr:hypothetical protein [Thiotrichaceae bacterium]